MEVPPTVENWKSLWIKEEFAKLVEDALKKRNIDYSVIPHPCYGKRFLMSEADHAVFDAEVMQSKPIRIDW